MIIRAAVVFLLVNITNCSAGTLTLNVNMAEQPIARSVNMTEQPKTRSGNMPKYTISRSENMAEQPIAPSVNVAEQPIARSRKMPVQPIKLYFIPPSLPCRAVIMTARALGLELELHLTDVMKGDHITPEFLKINPQHTIPTMDDNGLIIWESRAIMAYFVNAYGKDDALYPKNPRLRAMVDARLNFDLGTLYPRYINVYVPVIARGWEPERKKMEDLNEALGFLESMLTGRAYVAGDSITIADFSIITTITTLNALKYNLRRYPQLIAWFERTKFALERFGYTEIDDAGGKSIASMITRSRQ